MPHQRVVDNVATVPVLRGESRRTARKAALGVLERVGLDPKLANRYPGPAVRRSAAARRRGARAGRRPADPADGRAVQRRGPRGPRRAADRNPAAAKRIAQDDRVRHPRHRRGAQARRQGRGVRPRRRAAAVRPNRVRLLSNPANDFVAGLHRRRPRLSRACSSGTRPGCRCTTFGHVAETDIDGLHVGPERLGAGHSNPTARRSAGSTPTV